MIKHKTIDPTTGKEKTKTVPSLLVLMTLAETLVGESDDTFIPTAKKWLGSDNMITDREVEALLYLRELAKKDRQYMKSFDKDELVIIPRYKTYK